jgi:hypothetical protein
MKSRFYIDQLKHDARGSALVLALVMVTIVTIICSIMLNGVFLQLKFIRRPIHQRQALYLSEAGIHKAIWYLSGHGGRGPRWRTENERIELFDDHTATVSVRGWGGYLEIISRAEHKRVSRTVRALVGEKPPEHFEQAVIVGGTGYPIVVTGKNRIVGDVTVGPKGVEKGWIKGRGFEGKEPVQGRISRVQSPEMPYFDGVLFTEAFQKYRDLLQNLPGDRATGSDVRVDGEFIGKTQKREIWVDGNATIQDLGSDSLLRGPLLVGCTGDMSVQGRCRMGGAIELVAGGKIRAQDRLTLEDCILFAENGIEIRDDCRMTGQLLSPAGITLKDRTVLNYPSLVYCSGVIKDNSIRGQVSLQDRATVKGTVILCPASTDLPGKRDETSVSLDPNAKHVGVLYSSHFTQQQGTVYGNVSTGQFHLYVPPTTYLNWLRDATIDRSKLPDAFLMPLLFSTDPDLDVLVWEEVKDSILPRILTE